MRPPPQPCVSGNGNVRASYLATRSSTKGRALQPRARLPKGVSLPGRDSQRPVSQPQPSPATRYHARPVETEPNATRGRRSTMATPSKRPAPISRNVKPENGRAGGVRSSPPLPVGSNRRSPRPPCPIDLFRIALPISGRSSAVASTWDEPIIRPKETVSSYANRSSITTPATSVSRKSRP